MRKQGKRKAATASSAKRGLGAKKKVDGAVDDPLLKQTSVVFELFYPDGFPEKSSDWMKHPGVQAQQRSYGEFLRKRFHLDDKEKMKAEMEKWFDELGL